jgi:hypothetical protein
MGDGGEERRVGAARERHDDGAELTQPALEGSDLVIEIVEWGRRHHPIVARVGGADSTCARMSPE